MKICIIAGREFLEPLDPRVYKEARSMVSAGHQVAVVTPASRDGRRMIDGMRVVGIGKAAGLLRTKRRMLRAAVELDADIYYCHEIDGLVVGALAKVLTAKLVIYDAHEHYPSLLGEMHWISSPHRIFREHLVGMMEYLLTRFVDHVVTVNRTLARRFSKVFRKPTTIIHNSPDINLFSPENIDDAVASQYAGKDVVVYEGNIQWGRMLDFLSESQSFLKDSRSEVVFMVVGNPPNYFNINYNIIFTGWVSQTKVPHYISISRIGLTIFPATFYNNRICLPNKLFETMSCAKPVVASDLPEIRRVVKEANCGILVPVGDPKALADAIERLLSNPLDAEEMGKRGRRAMETKYGWHIQEKKLLRLLEKFDNP
ncbi:MAG: glycosyltransferase family 4 protein [Candidatus Thermoplasmatota archaeon]|nr:glycosyltransferase family 4 protein [Candidatus Thermoplasmatota archaeon]